MRAINQRGMLFTYLQENQLPDSGGDGSQYLQIFKPEKDESNITGGIVADIKFGSIISLSIYPPKNRRVLTSTGYIVKPLHDIETYRRQIENNEGLRFLYIPDLRGGFPSGVYRITEWDDRHSMTTGGKNKITARAEFIDTDSLIVSISEIKEEYNHRIAGSRLPVRDI